VPSRLWVSVCSPHLLGASAPASSSLASVHDFCYIPGFGTGCFAHVLVAFTLNSRYTANTLPLGIQRTWTRLLAGESGIVSTRHLGEEFTRIPSQVVGLVPLGKLADGGWDASEHVSREVSLDFSYCFACVMP
jgi:hypothetical protein